MTSQEIDKSAAGGEPANYSRRRDGGVDVRYQRVLAAAQKRDTEVWKSGVSRGSGLEITRSFELTARL